MNKAVFLDCIKEKIRHLPYEDLRRNLDFYGEMIDDRMEEGLSEEEAVATMELPELIAEKILDENDAAASQEATAKQTKRRWYAIPLSVLYGLILMLLWTAVAVVYAILISLAGAALVLLTYCVLSAVASEPAPALVFGGAALVCIGAFLFLLPVCRAVRRGSCGVGRRLGQKIKIAWKGR